MSSQPTDDESGTVYEYYVNEIVDMDRIHELPGEEILYVGPNPRAVGVNKSEVTAEHPSEYGHDHHGYAEAFMVSRAPVERAVQESGEDE